MHSWLPGDGSGEQGSVGDKNVLDLSCGVVT